MNWKFWQQDSRADLERRVRHFQEMLKHAERHLEDRREQANKLLGEVATMTREVAAVRAESLEFAAIKAALTHELRKATDHCAELSRRLAAVYQRTPAILTKPQQNRANVERLHVLAGIDANNPVWQTVLSYLDEHARNESDSALQPNLINAVRQFNTGRAADASDLASALRDLKAQADSEAAKQKAA